MNKGILYSNEKEQTRTWITWMKDMDEYYKHIFSQPQQQARYKRIHLYGSVYIEFRTGKTNL